MHDDLEDDLAEWGASSTPPVDGAFANRLEASLRAEMLDHPVRATRGWAGFVLRPGVVVVAIAFLVFGLAFMSRDGDEVGLAGGDETTVPTPTTLPTTTTVPLAPSTTGDPEPPGPDQTTMPQTTVLQTTVPQTTVPQTTVPATIEPPGPDQTTTVPPARIRDLRIEQNGRQVTVSWRFEGAGADRVAGWLLIASLDGDGDGDGDGDIVGSSRDVATRSLTGPLVDLDQIFWVEGINRAGEVVVSSDEVRLSRDG